MNKQLTYRAALCLVCLMAISGLAQTGTTNDIFAQKLVDKIIAKHQELRLIGLHAAPDGSSDSHIIANNIRAKVGKKSDPDDLEVMHTGKPVVEKKDSRKIFDIGMPLLDQSGAIIGTVVMEVKYQYASSEAAALEQATKVRDELKEQIPSKSKLFEKAE
jgi:hypothetical protein